MQHRQDDKLKQYFVAIIPPEPVYTDALDLKHYFKEHYNSKGSLNSPPHVTLHMPFRYKEEKEQDMIDNVKAYVCLHAPLKLCIDNFGCFEPRVIFMNVVKSVELEAFQKGLERYFKKAFNLFNANYREGPYHPHLTLAFRDLKKSMFQEAWKEFQSKTYKAEFIADKVALLKHNGKSWDVLKEFNLESTFNANEQPELEGTEG